MINPDLAVTIKCLIIVAAARHHKQSEFLRFGAKKQQKQVLQI